MIDSVKAAGLVLIREESLSPQGSNNDEVVTRQRKSSAPIYPPLPKGIDGVLRANGILKFNDTVDM